MSNGSFASVWIVGGLTGIVRWLQLLVLGIYTYQITGSPLLVSIVPMLWMLPLALCGPLIGVLADSFNRKVLLTVSIGAMIVLNVIVAFVAFSGSLEFAHIVIIALFSGLFWATDMPVRRRLLGDQSGELIATAMSLDSATSNATRMAGPLIGGVMLELFSVAGVFVLSASVFAFCMVVMFLTKVGEQNKAAHGRQFFRELLGGVSFVLGDAPLRRIFAVTIVFNLWGFPFTSMIPIIGTDRLGLSPLLVGMLSSAEGMGAFIGAIIVALYARPAVFFQIYLWGTTAHVAMVGYLGVLSYVAGGPTHSFVAATYTLLIIGIASACFSAMQGTLSYIAAPPEYRSRVLGVLTLCIGTGPIGFFNIGWMAETFGVPIALMITSLEGLTALLLLWVFARDPDSAQKQQKPLLDEQTS